MLFTKFIIASIVLISSPVLSAPTLINRQNIDETTVISQRESAIPTNTRPTASSPSLTETLTSELRMTRTASMTDSPSSTVSYTPSASASRNSTGLYYTNDFPDQVKNGDSIKLEWDGGEGPYLLYTILNYPGLSNVRPHVIESSTERNSYELIIQEDDSHDKSTITIGIASNKNSNQYKRITIPLVK